MAEALARSDRRHSNPLPPSGWFTAPAARGEMVFAGRANAARREMDEIREDLEEMLNDIEQA